MQTKGSSVLWNYQQADPEFGAMQAKEVQVTLESVLAPFSVVVRSGKGMCSRTPQPTPPHPRLSPHQLCGAAGFCFPASLNYNHRALNYNQAAGFCFPGYVEACNSLVHKGAMAVKFAEICCASGPLEFVLCAGDDSTDEVRCQAQSGPHCTRQAQEIILECGRCRLLAWGHDR